MNDTVDTCLARARRWRQCARQAARNARDVWNDRAGEYEYIAAENYHLARLEIDRARSLRRLGVDSKRERG